jgi:hypothetical protein
VAPSFADEFLISRGAILPVRRDRIAMPSNATRSAGKREMSAIALENLPLDPEGQQKPFACLGKIKTARAAVKQATCGFATGSSREARPCTRAGLLDARSPYRRQQAAQAASFLGFSAIIASVVTSRPATEAAS